MNERDRLIQSLAQEMKKKNPGQRYEDRLKNGFLIGALWLLKAPFKRILLFSLCLMVIYLSWIWLPWIVPGNVKIPDSPKQAVPDSEYEKALLTTLYITIVLVVIAVMAYSHYEKEDSLDIDLPSVPEKDSVLLNMDDDLKEKFKPTLDAYRKLVSKGQGNEPVDSEPGKSDPISSHLERDSGPEV